MAIPAPQERRQESAVGNRPMHFGRLKYRTCGLVSRPKSPRRSHAVARVVLPLAAGAVLAPLPLWSGGTMASSPAPVPSRIVCPALVREESAIREAMWGAATRKDSLSSRRASEKQPSASPHSTPILLRSAEDAAIEKQGYLPLPPWAGCFNQTVAPPRLPRSPPEY